MVGWCATTLIILTLLQPHKNCASIIFLKRGQPTLMRRISLQWIFMMHFERKVAEFAPSKTLQKAIDRIWSLFEFGGFACVFDLWLEDYRALDRYANSAPSTITIWMKVLKAPKIPFLVEGFNDKYQTLKAVFRISKSFIYTSAFPKRIAFQIFYHVSRCISDVLYWVDSKRKNIFWSTNICYLSRVVVA